MLTQAELKRIWSYDPATGLFTRLIKSRNKTQIGDVAKDREQQGYIRIMINSTRYKSHRLAWLYMTGEFSKNQIDHINGVRDDNRWCNLRDVTQSVNMQNQRIARKNNKSGYAGVTFDKNNNKWHTSIRIQNKQIFLGYFDDVHEAGAYRLQKKRELHPGCTV